MIEYISGSIADLSPTRIVIDNHGMGYGLEISLQTYESLRDKKEAKVFVFTTVNQRDATEVMYGFATKDERELFELIVGISGIGAASARMILSAMTADEFREAIISENINKIKSIKGIGLKSAQRMILELKDKIVKGEGTGSDVIFKADNSSDIEEATSALTMLGFSKPNVNKAIQAVMKKNPTAKVEEIIKAALKML
ncbi:MAG: Holliday junction branch migration protein RuvA [Bacteroidales bacterium]|nr:Holliday junction branch migration protein RuvA [Bacteroidales bacterium]MBR7004521.1 Holliday junction branch migration protein RuvA [Bacteroidales bacterium]